MNSQDKQVFANQLLKAVDGDMTVAMSALREAVRLEKKAKDYKPKSSEVVVDVQKVSKVYKVGSNKVAALKNVDLKIYKGEFVAITGTSGSGKSTLLQLIGGLDKPSDGEVLVNGKNLRRMRDGKLSHFRNRTIGFVFQFFYLQPFLKLRTNIEVPGMFARIKARQRRPQSESMAKTVGLSDRLNHFPKELSGGQMQRAAIARALQNQPSILLADEPTGNLDHANATAIFDLFKKIRDEKDTTVVVVTHDLSLAAMADRAIHMSDGALV